jgi:hypothetical protein
MKNPMFTAIYIPELIINFCLLETKIFGRTLGYVNVLWNRQERGKIT